MASIMITLPPDFGVSGEADHAAPPGAAVVACDEVEEDLSPPQTATRAVARGRTPARKEGRVLHQSATEAVHARSLIISETADLSGVSCFVLLRRPSNEPANRTEPSSRKSTK